MRSTPRLVETVWNEIGVEKFEKMTLFLNKSEFFYCVVNSFLDLRCVYIGTISQAISHQVCMFSNEKKYFLIKMC